MKGWQPLFVNGEFDSSFMSEPRTFIILMEAAPRAIFSEIAQDESATLQIVSESHHVSLHTLYK